MIGSATEQITNITNKNEQNIEVYLYAFRVFPVQYSLNTAEDNYCHYAETFGKTFSPL